MTISLRRRYLKLKTIVFLVLLLLPIFPALSSSRTHQTPIDILIFSPHPDDETLCCGGTILKAVQDNKRVKVVFLTNGDAYPEAYSAWLKKEPGELSPEDYIALGQQRQKEALAANIKLGLCQEDIIFLSYPDNDLYSLLWQNRDGVNSPLVKSKATGRNLSPYAKTYNRAKNGYTQDNLIADIRDILQECKPSRIYIPSSLDAHEDHQATTYFIYLILEELRKKKNEWVNSLEIFHYLIHNPVAGSGAASLSWPDPKSSLFKKPVNFSQEPIHSEDIADFKQRKQEALDEYCAQRNWQENKRFLESFVKDNELFWRTPTDKALYLKSLSEEWSRIAEDMHRQGYNINFGVVVDVAEDIEDMNNPLARRRRVYEEKPDVVTTLACTVIRGTDRGGITPVVKHFPGLGRCNQDTHYRLPIIEVPKAELYKSDLIPFREIINRNYHIWIMVDHAVYPCLSNKPASLSYEIQTELLRKELGFKGIIIVDELMNMQAIKEFALREKIKEPYIGKLVVMAFQAGADIVILYPPPGKPKEELILHVVDTVKQAVEKGELKQEDIDSSVRRILREKEEIFQRPLEGLLVGMSLEEKIAQRIIIDAYHDINVDPQFKDIEILKRHKLGGVYAYHPRIIEEIKVDSKIPPFIAGQHEGGEVNQFGLNLYTRSAYIIGKEFTKSIPCCEKGKAKDLWGKQKSKRFRQFNQLDAATRRTIICSLTDSLDEIIRLWLSLPQVGYLSPNPNYRSPLTIYSDGRIEIKPYENLPIVWLTRFPNEEMAHCAYQVFEKAFQDLLGDQKGLRGVSNIVSQLQSLKKIIQEIEAPKNESGIRILCLAAHPDDEDGEALAYFQKFFGCSTYILLATRGEAGENRISPALYEELGVLRTEEMERAAAILGVERVYYLGNNDFGYCGDPREALEKWNREDTLERLVYFYRLIRPHIIISKHNKSNTADHCQHQALAILAEEAFDLANDPLAYPEMIKQGLHPWQPLKFYQRSTEKQRAGEHDLVEINSDEHISSEGKTIQRIAFEALVQHRSQGNWQWLRTAKAKRLYYQLVKSHTSACQTADSFFNGIQVEPNLTAGSAQNQGEASPSGLPGVKIVNPLRIGLIEENNNILFLALKTLGYDFKRLDEEFLKKGNLSQFDIIIIGQGAYSIVPSLAKENKRLLKFVKKGGNLVVFPQDYQQPVFTYAPYNLKISFNPITDENAPVAILVPQHPLFNFPNKITVQDFEGWVQERGLSFPFEYSDKYTELISCISPDGAPIKSGYLVAHYGKGSYIYTNLSWLRQFREFHLGAHKNFANMLAYPYAEK